MRRVRVEEAAAIGPQVLDRRLRGHRAQRELDLGKDPTLRQAHRLDQMHGDRSLQRLNCTLGDQKEGQ